MPTTFRYKARDKQGKLVAATMTADSRDAVARQLASLGCLPVLIEEEKGAGAALSLFESLFKNVSLQDRNLFTRQLQTLQKAGIPLLTSLVTLTKQTQNAYFKEVIKGVAHDVEGGVSLSAGLAKYPRVFDELYISMVRAGEASGLLDDVLTHLAKFGEKEFDTQSRIKAALRYPMLTICALAAAFCVVTTFVIPRFAKMFLDFRASVPLPTKIMMGIGAFMQKYWYVVILSGIGSALLVRWYIGTREGRRRWDHLLLKLPIVGKLVTMFAMGRFSRTMAILVRSGLPILQVLDLVSRSVGNVIIAGHITRIAESVKDGKGLSEPMRQSGIFPPLVVSMVAVGEDTGRVDELLLNVADYYEQQADYMVENLTTMIEPIAVMLLGGLVLVTILSIFLPMWNLFAVFTQKM